MTTQKISTLLSLSLLTAPIGLPAFSPSTPTLSATLSPFSQRASLRRMKHLLATKPVLQPMGMHVGELQERWQFPSDHLPIGMTFDGHHIVSWNVLDAKFMSWVINNSQGLSRSMLVDEHVYIGDSKLTIRDQHVADLILQMISHPTHPRSLLSLQECSQPLLEELRFRLPAHLEIISAHGETVLLDNRRFELIEAKEVANIFPKEPQRAIQEILIRRLDNGQALRLLNVHLPGDPAHPGHIELSQYLAKIFDPAVTTLAMGDMNFNELEVADGMNQAFQHNSPFALYSPYCTNISPYTFHSKAIDHFLLYSPENRPVAISTPNQIMSELAPILALLKERALPLKLSS